MTRVGATQKQILRWIQENPWECMNTTCPSLAKKITEGSMYGETSVIQSLYKLIKNGMVLREQSSGKSKLYCNFSLNYNNLYLPKEIMERAPQHIKESLEEAKAKLKSGEYKAVDEYGAGIIEASEDFTEQDDTLTSSSAEKLEPKQFRQSRTPTKEKPTRSTPVATIDFAIQKSADGKSISINLTTNLNL